MTPLLRRLGLRVRRARLERRLSLRVLGAKSGLSTRFLTELEAGRANISVDRLAGLATALGLSAGSMLLDAERGRTPAAPTPERVALLGLRGAGKTAIGRRLATRLGVPFFELDGLVEEAAGLSLADVFRVHGEDYYRRLEADALRRWLAEHARGVLATGGGIVGNDEAFRMLREHTTTVWVRARPEDHWNRVVRQGDRRPMAGRPAAQEELRRILESRRPLYARARFQIDTSGLNVAECVRRLVRQLRGDDGGRRTRKEAS
jgi:XRE family aerobic/anaerobic benzoate catabolism transcriptional regulator